MHSGAKLCPASPRADATLRAALDAATSTIVEALGERCLAVVLAGSLARGQGMVVATETGPRVLSDVDLYVVRDGGGSGPETDLRRELERHFRDDGGVLAPLDLAFVEPVYFASLGDALPARQLALGSTVLYERAGARWERPDRAGAIDDPVDPDDAHRLLLNRMAESLLLAEEDPHFAAVHRAKQWIDAPLAWLGARGAYHPDRRIQLDRLEEMTDGWPEGPATHVRIGVEVARRWLDAIATRELSQDWLDSWPTSDDSASMGAGAEREWVWPFARALFSTPPRSGGAVDLLRAIEAEAPSGDDVARVRGWLTRRPVWTRLRQARRWHPLAPRAPLAWWRYGPGGSGEERVYAAAALRYAGLDGGDAIVEEMGIEARTDTGLGRLWADWILGGGRR